MEDQLCYSVIQALKDGATYAEARYQVDEGESDPVEEWGR